MPKKLDELLISSIDLKNGNSFVLSITVLEIQYNSLIC